MAAKKEKKYTCTAVYTEGCSERLTEALVDVYYNRLHGISSPPKDTKDTKEVTA